MFTIVNGYPLSGKTTYLLNEVKNSLSSGKEIVFITPEQQLVSAEREIADCIDPVYSLNVEVLSFRRLANRIFREYGGLCYNYLMPGGDLLIMWKAIMTVSPFLSLYNNISPGDISALSMFLELEKVFSRAGVKSKELSVFAEDEALSDMPNLKQKLTDLSLIFSTYKSLLNEKFTLPEDEVVQLAEAAFTAEFFKGKDVFIDGFNSFTGVEYKIIEKIAKGADNFFVTVNSIKDDVRDINHKPNQCRKVLLGIASKFANALRMVNTDAPGIKREELEHLQKNIFSFEPKMYDKAVNGIRIIEAKDPMSELEAIFEDIIDYVKNQGGRYRDCVICAGNIDSYSGIINGLSKSMNVPCFTSKRYSLSSRGAIRAIKLIANIYKYSFDSDRVVEFIKTGFSSLDEDEGVLIEEYIRIWNISGKKSYFSPWKNNPEGRGEEFDEQAEEKLGVINRIREKLINPFIAFECELEELEEINFAAYLSCLTRLLLALDMPGKLNRLSAVAENKKDLVAMQTHRQTWKQICQSFDAIYNTVGELKCGHDEFAVMFESVISAGDTGVIPTSMDCVLTGNALMLRPHNVKRVYFIGANDGEFPQDISNVQGVFSPRELSWLKERNSFLPDEAEEELFDSLFTFYSVACQAREFLQVSYHSSDMSGKMVQPSMVIEELLKLYKDINVNSITSRSVSALIYTKEAICRDGEDVITVRRWEKEEKLSKQTLDLIYSDKLYLSQSKIDTFVMCPFSYTCRYILDLKEEKSGQIKQNVFGTLIHYVLEKYLRTVTRRQGGFVTIERQEAYRLVSSIVDEYANSIGFDPLEEPRLYNLFRRVKHTVLLLVLDLKNEFKSSKFTPKAFEIAIGFEAKDGDIRLPSLVIPLDSGGDVVIRGYIDRLDSYTDNNNVYLRVVDYKTGDKKLTEKDIELGINIQMLLYMKCLCENDSIALDEATGRKEGQSYIPAGVIYHISKRPEGVNGEEAVVKRSGILLDDKEILMAMEPDCKGKYIPYKASSRVKSCLYSQDAFKNLLSSVGDTVKNVAEKIKDGITDISPMKTSGHDGCKYCKMLPVCRYRNNQCDEDDE